MRVSFIQATNSVDVQWSAPLAFGYLKAAAPDHEYSVARSNADIMSQRPDVLGISCMSQDFNEAVRISDYAKSIGVPRVVMGGHHITAFPNTLPGSADVAFIGESESSWAEFMSGGSQEVYRGALGNIDDIAPPDRMFGVSADQRPYLFTSRGCPFKCSFCASSVYWDKTRYHSPERVVAEIDSMGDVPHIDIWDDLFIVNKNRVRKISRLLRGRKTTFSTSAKASMIDDEMCEIMASMNLNRMGIGAESGSDRILKKLKTSNCSVAENQAALDAMKRHGIRAGAGFVFGHWEETEEDIHETYRWIMRNYAEGKLMNHEVNILTPMPGTPVWQWAEDNCFPVRDWDRLRFLSMNANKVGGLGAWKRLRRRNKSLYLNEHGVPQERLYDIICHYEKRIKAGRFGVLGVRGSGRKQIIKTAKAAIKNLAFGESV